MARVDAAVDFVFSVCRALLAIGVLVRVATAVRNSWQVSLRTAMPKVLGLGLVPEGRRMPQVNVLSLGFPEFLRELWLAPVKTKYLQGVWVGVEEQIARGRSTRFQAVWRQGFGSG